jgi:hypothetical protein
MATCFVHHCCVLPQFFSDQKSRITLVAISEVIVSLLVSKPHMVDVKPYLTFSLSNYYYANLHELFIKSILSSPAASNFFVSVTIVGLYVPESSISSP